MEPEMMQSRPFYKGEKNWKGPFGNAIPASYGRIRLYQVVKQYRQRISLTGKPVKKFLKVNCTVMKIDFTKAGKQDIVELHFEIYS